jgi:hypothetical protein
MPTPRAEVVNAHPPEEQAPEEDARAQAHIHCFLVTLIDTT